MKENHYLVHDDEGDESHISKEIDNDSYGVFEIVRVEK